MIIKRNWTRFLPYINVYFAFPFIRVQVLINRKDLSMFRTSYIRYAIEIWKWRWEIDLYSVEKEFLTPHNLTPETGIKWNSCDCIYFEKEHIRVFCKHHWKEEK